MVNDNLVAVVIVVIPMHYRTNALTQIFANREAINTLCTIKLYKRRDNYYNIHKFRKYFYV